MVGSESWEVFLWRIKRKRSSKRMTVKFFVSFFYFFLSFYVLYVQKVLLSTKHPTHESAGLFMHSVRFYSSDSPAKAKEEERRKEEERGWC